MLKQVQHDMTVRFWSFCHPELVSGDRFWVLEFRFKAPPCGRGSLLDFYQLILIKTWRRFQKSWQIRRGEVHVQEGYFRHGDLVSLNRSGGISAKHLRHMGVGDN
jgi:hypothetical protein